ncbi:MAG: ribosomal protein S18-alanine N-acetyltransferase [Proteobacteria bacterium]|nr:ribosomal protein S18-alanine N-acetyltransferase [Pseudomonadota bacterium]
MIELVSIEPMRDEDLDEVLGIEQASYRRPWNRSGFEVELSRAVAICLVARIREEVLGYLIFWLVRPEIHVLNIAVKPDVRQRGVGRLLLEYMFEYGRERGAAEVFLEVRPSNASAQRLYYQTGFVLTGKRRNYYSEDHEDALVMIRRL